MLWASADVSHLAYGYVARGGGLGSGPSQRGFGSDRSRRGFGSVPSRRRRRGGCFGPVYLHLIKALRVKGFLFRVFSVSIDCYDDVTVPAERCSDSERRCCRGNRGCSWRWSSSGGSPCCMMGEVRLVSFRLLLHFTFRAFYPKQLTKGPFVRRERSNNISLWVQ